ncbi:MAG: hypothetical protein A3J99_00455 [Sideroxydans sp. RIFOXYD2_FULL_59_7]|nr:MAG: hypothetical protein A3J99_00455 [Sideroxydans sp. RIFOXYD2_FULL_59_7]
MCAQLFALSGGDGDVAIFTEADGELVQRAFPDRHAAHCLLFSIQLQRFILAETVVEQTLRLGGAQYLLVGTDHHRDQAARRAQGRCCQRVA